MIVVCVFVYCVIMLGFVFGLLVVCLVGCWFACFVSLLVARSLTMLCIIVSAWLFGLFVCGVLVVFLSLRLLLYFHLFACQSYCPPFSLCAWCPFICLFCCLLACLPACLLACMLGFSLLLLFAWLIG